MKDDTTESTVTNFDKTKNDITISRDEFFDFIKNKKDTDGNISTSTQHYLNYFDQYQKTGKIKCWNWAGLWSYAWFFYRRMGFNGFVLLISWIIFDNVYLKCIENYITSNLYKALFHFVFFIICFIFMIPSVMYGNYLYLHYVNTQVSKGILTRGPSKTALFIGILIAISLSLAAGIILNNINIIYYKYLYNN